MFGEIVDNNKSHQGRWRIMEWFEHAADGCTWIFPIFAGIALWIARLVENPLVRTYAERIFFAVLLLVAAGTLRTMLAEDPSWFLNACSLGIMIVGAVMPTPVNSEPIQFGDHTA